MRATLLLAALIGLAACETPGPADFDPHHRFRNTVEKKWAVAALSDSPALTAADRAVIADLGREHLRRGAGPVQVGAAADSLPGIRAALDEAGIEAVTVETRPGAPRISVPIWVANVPDCGTWPARISPDYNNQNTANFGCAVTRNIGLMVANPADLERAREATGRSGVRSSDVLTKYGEGKATGSKTEEAKPGATLSNVGAK